MAGHIRTHQRGVFLRRIEVEMFQQDSKMPAALADLALIDAATCARAGGMSSSRWYSLVQSGVAPKPAVSQVRFVRWRVADVAAFLEKLASDSTIDASEANLRRAKNARHAGLRKRANQLQSAAA